MLQIAGKMTGKLFSIKKLNTRQKRKAVKTPMVIEVFIYLKNYLLCALFETLLPKSELTSLTSRDVYCTFQ